MQRLDRVQKLEARVDPDPAERWVRVYMYAGQTKEQAIAAHEAEHGLIGDNDHVLRVVISKPYAAPAHA